MMYIDYPNIKERNVGGESSRTFHEKLYTGFFDRYMSGEGLEVGSKGYNNAESILPTATPVNLGDSGYDGLHLPYADESQSFVYSSHVLEHVANYKSTLQEWFRVLKVGGHMVVVVPHKWLYEKVEKLPSQFNGEHQRLYEASTLCREVEESLGANTFRIRHLLENDRGHDYLQPRNQHSVGAYEIEIVVQKLDPKFAWDKNK